MTSANMEAIMRQHDENRRQATEEWLNLDAKLQRAVSSRTMSSTKATAIHSEAQIRYQDWLKEWRQERDALMPRQQLLSRVGELEQDLADCLHQLDGLIELAGNPGTSAINESASTESLLRSTPSGSRANEVSNTHLRQLETINADVMGMRKTVAVSSDFNA